MNYRDASRQPAFFDGFIDSRAILPFVLLILNISWMTFAIAFISSIFFVVLSLNKYTIPRLYLKARSFVRGNIVTGRPFWMKKRRY